MYPDIRHNNANNRHIQITSFEMAPCANYTHDEVARDWENAFVMHCNRVR